MAGDRNVQFFLGMDVQKFLQGLGQASQATGKFVRETESKFAKSTKGIDKFIAGFAAPLAGLVAAGTVYKAARDVADLDDKIARMGIDSGMSNRQMLEFKDQILSTGVRTGVATNGLLEMSDAALASSKNIKFVKDNMGLMTTVMAATGASGREVGDAMGSIYENTGLAGDELKSLMDRLYTFGKGTSREARLKEILPSMEQMVKTAKMMYGPKASTKQIGDFIITSMFTGSPGATSKMMMSLLTPTTRKHLKTLGLDIKKSISISDVLTAESKKFGSNRQAMIANLTEIFGKRNALTLEKLVNEQEDYNKAVNENRGGDLFKDASRQADTMAAAMNKINASFLQIADASLTPIMTEMAKAIKDIDPASIKALAESFSYLGKALGTVVVGWSKLIGLAYEWVTGEQAGIVAKNEQYAALMGEAGQELAKANRLRAEGRTREADVAEASARAKIEGLRHPELDEKRLQTKGELAAQAYTQQQQPGLATQNIVAPDINIYTTLDGEQIAHTISKRDIKIPRGMQLSVIPQ